MTYSAAALLAFGLVSRCVDGMALWFRGGSFGLDPQTVHGLDEGALSRGTPVRDHFSCHQVRLRTAEHLPKSENVAVLIPFREQGAGQERHQELQSLMDTLLPFAKRKRAEEGVSFKFYVVEQTAKGGFNRGALMNVGFQRAGSFFGEAPFTAVAQDCDLVPDERMLRWYTRAGDGPLHLDSYNYCPGFGGVTIFRDQQYKAMNGYSHSMFGWGGEDDDAMDRWMSDPNRIVIAPADGERFVDLGRAEDKARDKTFYSVSMEVWKRDNENQAWISEGLSALNYTVVSAVPSGDADVEHVVVELGGSN